MPGGNSSHPGYELSSNLITTTIYNTIKNAIFIYFECNVTFTFSYSGANNLSPAIGLYASASMSSEYMDEICLYEFNRLSGSAGTATLSVPGSLTNMRAGMPPSQTVPIIFRSLYCSGTDPKFLTSLEGQSYTPIFNINCIYFGSSLSAVVSQYKYSGTMTIKYI